jgi:hypothetical protein
MSRQPPVPKGWRFLLKPSEVNDFFPDVDEILWFGEPQKPYPGYEQPTISLSRLRPSTGSYEDDAIGFKAIVNVVPIAELAAAREWLINDVMHEVHNWLATQREKSPTRGRSTYAHWYWPSKRTRIHTDSYAGSKRVPRV